MVSKQLIKAASGICLLVAAGAMPMQPKGKSDEQLAKEFKDFLAVQRNAADGYVRKTDFEFPTPADDGPVMAWATDNNKPRNKQKQQQGHVDVNGVRFEVPNIPEAELYRIYNLALTYVSYNSENPTRAVNAAAYKKLKELLEAKGLKDPLAKLRSESEGYYRALRDLYMIRETYARERATNAYAGNKHLAAKEAEVRKRIADIEAELATNGLLGVDELLHVQEPQTFMSMWVYAVPNSEDEATENAVARQRTSVRPEFVVPEDTQSEEEEKSDEASLEREEEADGDSDSRIPSINQNSHLLNIPSFPEINREASHSDKDEEDDDQVLHPLGMASRNAQVPRLSLADIRHTTSSQNSIPISPAPKKIKTLSPSVREFVFGSGAWSSTNSQQEINVPSWEDVINNQPDNRPESVNEFAPQVADIDEEALEHIWQTRKLSLQSIPKTFNLTEGV